MNSDFNFREYIPTLDPVFRYAAKAFEKNGEKASFTLGEVEFLRFFNPFEDLTQTDFETKKQKAIKYFNDIGQSNNNAFGDEDTIYFRLLKPDLEDGVFECFMKTFGIAVSKEEETYALLLPPYLSPLMDDVLRNDEKLQRVFNWSRPIKNLRKVVKDGISKDVPQNQQIMVYLKSEFELLATNQYKYLDGVFPLIFWANPNVDDSESLAKNAIYHVVFTTMTRLVNVSSKDKEKVSPLDFFRNQAIAFTEGDNFLLVPYFETLPMAKVTKQLQTTRSAVLLKRNKQESKMLQTYQNCAADDPLCVETDKKSPFGNPVGYLFSQSSLDKYLSKDKTKIEVNAESLAKLSEIELRRMASDFQVQIIPGMSNEELIKALIPAIEEAIRVQQLAKPKPAFSVKKPST